ncbi:MAG TPA: hypothetical protein RMH99_06180, partial [Sandaracinaceae bacterium LLY-WYZ-13_1]|nr:hypothetical protein [Sandaracinaceae bacterium LLY-WYZ-13_1]
TGDGATEDGQETPGPAAAPASGAVGRARAEASEPAETGAGRAFRLRLALVAFAGIESYGYGGGARLEIPLFRMLPDADDAISLGIDLGVSGTHVGLDDQGHGFDAFQIPIATYASWRVVVGDLEIGPRLGAVLMPRFAWISGPRLEGFFADLVGMFLVGAHAGLFLSDDVQLFGGLDLTFGPRVSGLITAGVAL